MTGDGGRESPVGDPVTDRLRSATDRILAHGQPGRHAPAPHTDSGPSAWDCALRLLGVRARSYDELRRRLTDKDFPAADVEQVMNRLAETGLIDDGEFAREWVRARHTHQGRGRIALRHELRNKGVDPAVAERALSTIDVEDERGRASALVATKTASLSATALSNPRERERSTRRIVGMLVRRGYPQAMALDVVRNAIDAMVRECGD